MLYFCIHFILNLHSFPSYFFSYNYIKKKLSFKHHLSYFLQLLKCKCLTSINCPNYIVLCNYFLWIFSIIKLYLILFKVSRFTYFLAIHLLLISKFIENLFNKSFSLKFMKIFFVAYYTFNFWDGPCVLQGKIYIYWHINFIKFFKCVIQILCGSFFS